MAEAIIKKDGIDYPLQTMPLHYPADRVYLDGDTSKNVQDALDKLKERKIGWHAGIYVVNGNNNGYSIFCPYDVQNKGVPNISELDIQYVGTYSTNTRVTTSRPNGFFATCDNLPQDSSYVGNICSIYITS